MLLEPITVMIVAGLIWRLQPKYMTEFAYKSKLAKKSPESWAFAQIYFGKTTFFTHVVILVLSAGVSVAGILLRLEENVFVWTVTGAAILQTFGILVNILNTEHKLKKFFRSK